MNEKDIKALKWEKDKRIGLGGGLYLNLRRSSKTYIVRKTEHGKATVITLGKHDTLSLKDAKSKAMKLQRAKDISNLTMSKLKEKYWEEIVQPSSKVPKQVEGYLNNIDEKFGRRKVIDITRAMLVSFIQDYSTVRGARSADRIRSYLKQLFSYAVELGILTGSPMSEVTKRITGYNNVERTRVLSPTEIKKVWSWGVHQPKGNYKSVDNVRLIKFLLLTGLRISEAQNGYIDDNKFRIDDTKGKHSINEKRPHWVYLTETAKAQLPLPKTTATNIQAWLKRKLINEGYTSGGTQDAEKSNRFTPHDCRRSFATLANENGIMPHIVEKVLNHKMDGMMAVYNHAEYEEERIACAEKIESVILRILKKESNND